ncbi:MAG TPA: aminoacyl-tRNA hydrolase [Candidatus Babeliales bacterium]|nr:aminoacyl-tRNA hydrolase [Candidatus Babeliales bacterium]
MSEPNQKIQAIIGLGNPGAQFEKTRHNIGFRVVDQLAAQSGSSWSKQTNLEQAVIEINQQKICLIKPQTFMNDSGQVISYLTKRGIKSENILVVHDELELPFGVLKFKQGGSAKGHNGLKSIIAVLGDNFLRLRFGIDRPARSDSSIPVDKYVLAKFSAQEEILLPEKIDAAIELIRTQIISVPKL